jgi:hypothetical protein
MSQAQRAVIAVLVLLVIWCAWQSRLSSSHHSENNSAPNHADDYAAKKETLTALPDDRIFGWAAIDVFTGLLFVATVGLGIIGVCSLRNQSRETKILQRAYLAVESGGAELVSIRNSVAHIIIKNVGNLPARNVSWFIEAKFSEDGRRSDFPIDKSVIYGNNVVSPGTEMKRSQNFKATIDEISALQTEKTNLYVWGQIFYSDGFGENRFTKFCHRYSRGLITSSSAYLLRADSMRYHQFGNDAD